MYYRAGYDPAEYSYPEGRETRLRLEIARPIKCPDVLTHLTGFKIVQQALAQPGVVERFLGPEMAAKITATFMPMLAFDDPGAEAYRIAKDRTESQKYVLKPNLEGGGHNVYREAILGFLNRIPEPQWRKYILMRLIDPPANAEGVLLMPEDLYQGPIISELGILGTCMWRKRSDGTLQEIMRNDKAGWTFKTKPASEDEMSVVKGYGCFDCPKLVD